MSSSSDSKDARQRLAVVAVLEVAMVEAVHVDVLNAFLGQQLAERSQRAVLDVEPLPDLPELDL